MKKNIIHTIKIMSYDEIMDYLNWNLYSENGIHINTGSTFRVYSGDLQGYKINKNTDQIFKIYNNPFCFKFLNFMYKLYVSCLQSKEPKNFVSLKEVLLSYNDKNTVDPKYSQFLLKDIFLVIRTDLSTVEKSLQRGKNYSQSGTEKNDDVSKLIHTKMEIIEQLRAKELELEFVKKNEIFNEKTQIGQTKYGLPLGFIEIEQIKLHNVTIENNEICNVIISVRPTREDKNLQRKLPPIPPKISSKPAIEKSVGTADRDQNIFVEKILMFNQTFHFAPIGTHDAEIIIDVFKLIPNQKDTISKLGSVRVELQEFASQETKSFSKNLLLNNTNTQSVLNFNARFQYSKIVPLQDQINVLVDKRKLIDKQIASLKSRKPQLS